MPNYYIENSFGSAGASGQRSGGRIERMVHIGLLRIVPGRGRVISGELFADHRSVIGAMMESGGCHAWLLTESGQIGAEVGRDGMPLIPPAGATPMPVIAIPTDLEGMTFAEESAETEKVEPDPPSGEDVLEPGGASEADASDDDGEDEEDEEDEEAATSPVDTVPTPAVPTETTGAVLAGKNRKELETSCRELNISFSKADGKADLIRKLLAAK